MTIREIIRNGKGKSHAWRVVSDNPEDGWTPWTYRTLWHYSTPMAQWREHRHTGDIQLVSCGVGHGSVSDQNGMNILFRELDLSLYYSRAGGACIHNTVTRGPLVAADMPWPSRTHSDPEMLLP